MTRRRAVADHRVPARGGDAWRRRAPRARWSPSTPAPSVWASSRSNGRCSRGNRRRRRVVDAPGPGQRARRGRPPRRGCRRPGRACGGARPAAPGRRRGSRSSSTCSSLGEPRQPRLHAVEGQALGQPLPLLAAPRLGGDQRLGPRPHLVGGQQLAAREDLDLGSTSIGRALVGDRELGEPVDLVAPQVDAHRRVGGGREHVDDRAPHRDLAAVLDLVLAPVAGAHEPLDQLGRVELVARAARRSARRPRRGGRAAAPAPAPAPRRPAGRVRVVRRRREAPHGAQPAAHRLDARAHPLERQRLPRREQVDLRRRRGRPRGRAPAARRRASWAWPPRSGAGSRCAPSAGDGDGPRRLGHGQHRACVRPEHLPSAGSSTSRPGRAWRLSATGAPERWDA